MPNSELQKQEKLLELKTATPKNLAKYGHLIQSPLKLDNGNTPYYGEAVVTTPIPFLSINDTNLTLATLNPRPMEVRWMEYHNKHTQKVSSPLSGNSISHERRILRRYMPEVESFFHYRNVDVSSIKELIKRWHPKILEGYKKHSGHRAMADVLESIEELRYYKENFFV